jgi:putative long chain acyl-CoA synthase
MTLCPGGSVPTADLNTALAELPVGNPPDIVHVVPDMTLGASYRPLLGPLRAAGLPKSSRYAWYLDDETGVFKRLTAAVRAELAGDDGDD